LKTYITDRDEISEDYIEYFGATGTGKQLVTFEKVEQMIAARGGGGASFTFKGTIDATDNANYPGTNAVGDYYMNDTAGSAGTSFVGIACTTLAVNQLIVYTSNTDPWVTGASAAPADVYVPLAGKVNVTGPLTFTYATSAFINGPTGSNITLSSNGIVQGLVLSSAGATNVGTNLTVNGTSTLTARVTCQDVLDITGNTTI
jgi:hypothetical protein